LKLISCGKSSAPTTSFPLSRLSTEYSTEKGNRAKMDSLESAQWLDRFMDQCEQEALSQQQFAAYVDSQKKEEPQCQLQQKPDDAA